MTIKRRLQALERISLEAEIARIGEYYATLSEVELDLIIAFADEVALEYSPGELEFFNRHVETVNGFWDVAQAEFTRRNVAELLATGKATQAEIDEIFERYSDA